MAAGLMLTHAVAADLGPLEKLISPGALSQPHARFEGQCSQCHKPFSKGAQDDMCMSCHDHEAIRLDRQQRRGFHGRLAEKSCRVCHSEHKGRRFDILGFDQKRFDHEKTDYSLTGKHADKKVKCSACHRKGKPWREAPSDCYSCHRKNDEHKGGLGKQCEQCHSTRDWKKTRFDHSRTRFSLTGKHRTIECKACHSKHKYENTPRDCFSCHRQDDKHKGKLGKDCGRCHNDRSWKKAKFDHGLARFPLLGKHAQVKCDKCHKKRDWREAPRDCYSCHRKDDEHKGSMGKACESCHGVHSWKSWFFDHDKRTEFKLTGRHKGLKCKVCHVNQSGKGMKLPGDCYSCHQTDDVHDGNFGRICQRCHNTKSFREITGVMPNAWER